jgi:hypothetical protein
MRIRAQSQCRKAWSWPRRNRSLPRPPQRERGYGRAPRQIAKGAPVRQFVDVEFSVRRSDTEGRFMKKFACAVLSALALTSPAFAQKMTSDDLKWINQCISDNKGEEGGTPAIIRAYCICMNEKMDDNETRSVTQWEKANPEARQDCEKQAGWK